MRDRDDRLYRNRTERTEGGFSGGQYIRLSELLHSIARLRRARPLDTMTLLVSFAEGAVMTTEIGGIQDRNIAAVFNRLDANGNGVVTKADFDAIAQQICAQFAIPADSEAGQSIGESFQSWWEQLRRDLDTDHDGRITLEEFASAYKDGDPAEYFAEKLGRTAATVAEAVDSDDDGFITEDEYVSLLSVAITDQQAILAGFHQLDTDGDGRISRAEFEAGVAAVMLSDDPATPGTAMMGQTP
ncbi:MAG TPA: EF-hand domain-containing protein [Actinophytocola sp.]|uniref:EF-hand domain-containing protein n=1 Tax=Actinophytocola sp. TaxID=1872138 RepID=UPI002E022041|nr:EF-hand domain-containing protein [Actinophytocola sp.]